MSPCRFIAAYNVSASRPSRQRSRRVGKVTRPAFGGGVAGVVTSIPASPVGGADVAVAIRACLGGDNFVDTVLSLSTLIRNASLFIAYLEGPTGPGPMPSKH